MVGIPRLEKLPRSSSVISPAGVNPALFMASLIRDQICVASESRYSIGSPRRATHASLVQKRYREIWTGKSKRIHESGSEEMISLGTSGSACFSYFVADT